MSARSEILGWVIRRLDDVDAADPLARQALFDALRREVQQAGFGALAPDEALPHLESAIARQDVYWLGQQPPTASNMPPQTPHARDEGPPPPIVKWGWRRFLPQRKTPPGPPPGEATGPYADHVYETVPLVVRGQATDCRLSWAYDPACTLTAHCEAIGFAFETRAFSFRHAVEHLGAILHRGGLTLPVAAFSPDAVWATADRDGETVCILPGAPVHAFSAL